MCIRPITLKVRQDVVPCGKCCECKAKRRQDWWIRLREEYRDHIGSYFVTLTYSDDYCDGNLKKKHLQDYIKRVRSIDGVDRIKYYAIGEYGRKTNRPHYHIIMYGIGAQIEKAIKKWEYGNVSIGHVTDASINYICKYHLNPSRYVVIGKTREFSLMSKSLGMRYVRNNKHRYGDNVSDIVEMSYNVFGKKMSLPRYYKDKLLTDDDREMIANIDHVYEQYQKNRINYQNNRKDSYYEYLVSSNKNKERKYKEKVDEQRVI